MKRALATTAGTAVLVLTAAVPAAAHTSLIASSPGSGSTVRPPAAVELTYGDPVRFVGVVVLDAQGRHHEAGGPRVVDAKVTQAIAGTLPNGPYTVGWRVVAPDGHPVTGRYQFTVTGGAAAPARAPAAPAEAPAASSTAPSSAGWWWAGLAALLVAGAAGGVFRIRQRPRKSGPGKIGT